MTHRPAAQPAPAVRADDTTPSTDVGAVVRAGDPSAPARTYTERRRINDHPTDEMIKELARRGYVCLLAESELARK